MMVSLTYRAFGGGILLARDDTGCCDVCYKASWHKIIRKRFRRSLESQYLMVSLTYRAFGGGILLAHDDTGCCDVCYKASWHKIIRKRFKEKFGEPVFDGVPNI